MKDVRLKKHYFFLGFKSLKQGGEEAYALYKYPLDDRL